MVFNYQRLSKERFGGTAGAPLSCPQQTQGMVHSAEAWTGKDL